MSRSQQDELNESPGRGATTCAIDKTTGKFVNASSAQQIKKSSQENCDIHNPVLVQFLSKEDTSAKWQLAFEVTKFVHDGEKTRRCDFSDGRKRFRAFADIEEVRAVLPEKMKNHN